jgi:hypothetical protein
MNTLEIVQSQFGFHVASIEAFNNAFKNHAAFEGAKIIATFALEDNNLVPTYSIVFPVLDAAYINPVTMARRVIASRTIENMIKAHMAKVSTSVTVMI